MYTDSPLSSHCSSEFRLSLSAPSEHDIVEANQMFVPEKVFIKPQSKADPATAEIMRRVKSLDPNIPIVNMRGRNVSFPNHSSPVRRWRQRTKNLILGQRTTPFLTTFASPGKIVERMGTILNLCWQCPCNCEFCYLQSVLPADRIIYTNIDKLNREMSVEPYVHRSLLSLWTAISFAKKETLQKIPANFQRVGNYIRQEYVDAGVSSKNEAVELLETILRRRGAMVFKMLQGDSEKKKSSELGFRAKDLKVDRRTLSRYYEKNSKYFPRISAAEYTDIIALDHLCGHSNVLMDQVARIPEIEVTVRTKSAYVDEMVAHNGENRVTIALNFNTPYVIEHYEQGTASLEERLLAGQKVQAARGFLLNVVIEPVIKYPGYEKDYVALASRIVKSVNPSSIKDIAVGCVRYSGRLEARIKRNVPATNLFEDAQGLLPVEMGDRRRYTLEERVRIYRLLFDEFRKHTKAFLRLGAETPDAWESLGLDQTTLMKKSVYQYGR